MPALFFPEYSKQTWDLGFVGRHSHDCLPVLERLLLEPARRWNEGRFLVVGSRYPRSLRWPGNVKRVTQISPQKRRAFYNSQRFTLDLMPPDTLGLGYSPSARLFEAAACGTPVITEFWPGLEAFFTPDEEILISHSADETMIYLEDISELDRPAHGLPRAHANACWPGTRRAIAPRNWKATSWNSGAVRQPDSVINERNLWRCIERRNQRAFEGVTQFHPPHEPSGTGVSPVRIPGQCRNPIPSDWFMGSMRESFGEFSPPRERAG